MIPERIIFVSRGITVLNSGQHPERIKTISYRNLREITFRLTNVIQELITFVSRGITVLNSGQHPERIKRFSIETYGNHVSANECDFGTNYLR